jgi:hypothetical protein
MQFILAFGVSFLLPVLLMLLNRAGIVSRDALVKARRYVIVGIVALAALITPPDVVSQLMLAMPLLILFEGTLIVMRFAEKADAEEKARAEAEEAAAALRRKRRVNPRNSCLDLGAIAGPTIFCIEGNLHARPDFSAARMAVPGSGQMRCEGTTPTTIATGLATQRRDEGEPGTFRVGPCNGHQPFWFPFLSAGGFSASAGQTLPPPTQVSRTRVWRMASGVAVSGSVSTRMKSARSPGASRPKRPRQTRHRRRPWYRRPGPGPARPFPAAASPVGLSIGPWRLIAAAIPAKGSGASTGASDPKARRAPPWRWRPRHRRRPAAAAPAALLP